MLLVLKSSWGSDLRFLAWSRSRDVYENAQRVYPKFHIVYPRNYNTVWRENNTIIIIFTARCICISAVYAVTRCPSVCHVRDCPKTNIDIFSPSGSQAILVFPYQTGWRCSDRKLGTPLKEGVECKGAMRNDDFRPISRFIWETVIARWAHSAMQFVSIEFSFHPYNI